MIEVSGQRYTGAVHVDGVAVVSFHGVLLSPDQPTPPDCEEAGEYDHPVNYLQEITTQPQYRRRGLMREAIDELVDTFGLPVVIYPLPLQDADATPDEINQLRAVYRRCGFADAGALMKLGA